MCKTNSNIFTIENAKIERKNIFNIISNIESSDLITLVNYNIRFFVTYIIKM